MCGQAPEVMTQGCTPVVSSPHINHFLPGFKCGGVLKEMSRTTGSEVYPLRTRAYTVTLGTRLRKLALT